jgi:hypothetical protein
VAKDLGRILVEVAEQTPKAEEGAAPVTTTTFPFLVVDATEMA